MIEFNDSNADVTRNGFSIFFDPVDTSEDVFVGSTCIFMDDFRTTGNLKAQYSLTVQGSLTVGDHLSVGEDLTCGSLEGDDIYIERNLYVREGVSSKKIFIGGNADLGNIYAQDITSYGNIFVREGIDVQGDVKAERAVIGLDYISISGVLKCLFAVSESVDAGDNQTGSSTITKQPESEPEPETEPEVDEEEIKEKPPFIAESEIKEIFDGNSNLAIGMEDCALFIERLNEQLCKMEPTDNEILNYLDAYGSFIPSYHMVLDIMENSLAVLSKANPAEQASIQGLLTCGNALILFPEWFKDSIVVTRYKERFKEILDSVIEAKSRTKSRSKWMQALGLIERFKEQYSEETGICSKLDELSELLFKNTGLKALSVKLYLPEK